MPTLRTTYVQDAYAESLEYSRVIEVSDHVLDHLNEPEAQRLLADANAPGQSSALVQASFEDRGVTWLPLVHPRSGERTPPWPSVHRAWIETQQP